MITYIEALDIIKDVLSQHKERILDEPAVMAYSAMEKQIPAAPVNKEKYDYSQYLTFTENYKGRCPRCNARIGSPSQYCPDCGQKIDWDAVK